MNVSNDSRSVREIWEDKSLPLWRRTQLRLARMETFAAQRMITSDGFNERIQLQSESIQLACRRLVLVLKDWEERGAGSRTS